MRGVVVALLATVLAVWTAPRAAQHLDQPVFPRTKVLLLGTFHMANPGNDVFNVESDDMLVARRQAEIQAVVESLAAFQPTKVALESDFGTERLADRYRSYLAGSLEPSRNEIVQIGYRLAGLLGHATVYPVDADVDGIDPRPAWAEFPEIEAAKSRYAQGFFERRNLRSSTVGEYLLWLNSPEYRTGSHFFYTAFDMRMTTAGDDRSVIWLSDWYKRNLLIVANLLKIANPDGSDRLFVMFGAGHSYLLTQFLSESPHFELVESRDYLPRTSAAEDGRTSS